MKLLVKDMDIATGDVRVVIINEKDAALLDLHHEDRLLIKKGKLKTTAVLDIAESNKAVPQGHIGLFEEVLDALNAKHNDAVEITFTKKPISIQYIREKLEGKELSYVEIYEIINDIVQNKLTDIELASYVVANYTRGMTMKEIVSLTKAMTETGSVLKFKKKPIVDLHCIGGVPGNRTTMIVVPILAAAGLTVPKTSSRAITSPAGTADTMEVLCDVTLSPKKLKQILDKSNAFIIWGGAVNLAPADERIIKIEHPLSIDAEGQMLASIMAKKASVSATHLLLDLPIGKGTKVYDVGCAKHLRAQFENLGRELGIIVYTMLSVGSAPIGNGIGPTLEARDCLWILENDSLGPEDLRQKSIEMAAKLLELTGLATEGNGIVMAESILKSGAAHAKMMQMIDAQGAKIKNSNQIKLSNCKYTIHAKKTGIITSIDNIAVAKIARIAGAPRDAEAGIYLHKQKGTRVKKGEKIFTLYAKNSQKLAYAKEAIKQTTSVVIQ